MSRRVVVVGAGPGGLASAMLLASAGFHVTVLERRERPGGRSAAIEAPGGYRFDTGPTFFLYPRVLGDIFAACGRRLEQEIELIRLDPQYHLVFGAGGELKASGDLVRLQQEVARLAPGDAVNLPRFMADSRRKLAAFRPVLESKFDGLQDLMRPGILQALRYLNPHRSLDAELGRYFADPRIRLAFSFQSKYLGMSPFRCPSLFTILSFMEYEHGVWHPRGGCGAVMEAMARIARDLGVVLSTGVAVEALSFRGRRATGVRTAEGELEADAVILNADFAHAMQRLVPDRLRRRWTDARIARKRFSCSTFMLYLGIEGRADGLAHHTIYLAADYKRNIREIEHGATVPSDPSFYVQNASISDPSLAPPGHSTLYVLVPVGHLTGKLDWAREQAAFRAATLKRLRLIGLDDVERRIRFEKMVTPERWAADLAIHKGATFNLAHSLDQMLHRRPHNRFEDLDRVYLVGGGTHPGSGLPVIFESARITARLIAEDLGVAPASSGPAPQPAERSEPAVARAVW